MGPGEASREGYALQRYSGCMEQGADLTPPIILDRSILKHNPMIPLQTQFNGSRLFATKAGCKAPERISLEPTGGERRN